MEVLEHSRILPLAGVTACALTAAESRGGQIYKLTAPYSKRLFQEHSQTCLLLQKKKKKAEETSFKAHWE